MKTNEIIETDWIHHYKYIYQVFDIDDNYVYCWFKFDNDTKRVSKLKTCKKLLISRVTKISDPTINGYSIEDYE